jgi:NAD(P)-dependent dehydrogenase (short-subunit alcohol dehydrogenase family)
LRGLLEGRKALVTGAARGIGLATARRFREEGAAVAVSDIDDDALECAAGSIDGAVAVPFDVSHEEAVERGVEEAAGRLGGLDVLVANAGILRLRRLVDEELDEFKRVLDVNLVGAFLCLRAAGRIFREQGHGVILATASQAGLHGYAGLGAYCASKFGVVGLVETLAKELGPHGIRVNCVAPGLIRTDMYDAVAANAGGPLAGSVPLKRVGEPAEVAAALAFLASGEASYVSGATVVIDGGEGS